MSEKRTVEEARQILGAQVSTTDDRAALAWLDEILADSVSLRDEDHTVSVALRVGTLRVLREALRSRPPEGEGVEELLGWIERRLAEGSPELVIGQLRARRAALRHREGETG